MKDTLITLDLSLLLSFLHFLLWLKEALFLWCCCICERAGSSLPGTASCGFNNLDINMVMEWRFWVWYHEGNWIAEAEPQEFIIKPFIVYYLGQNMATLWNRELAFFSLQLWLCFISHNHFYFICSYWKLSVVRVEIFKKELKALASLAQLVVIRCTKRSWVWFQIRAHTQVVNSIPG